MYAKREHFDARLKPSVTGKDAIDFKQYFQAPDTENSIPGTLFANIYN